MRGSQSKSGKPWPRLTAPFSAASALMTVKIVVPTSGRRERRVGVVGMSCGAFIMACAKRGGGGSGECVAYAGSDASAASALAANGAGCAIRKPKSRSVRRVSFNSARSFETSQSARAV
ncbi:hypothetical protein BG19_3497 [Burkholderia pseudomallei MSHR840]|nr:hypothetical protein BG19_3497 [Burkholderia pseudomallei MSHR840]